MRLLKNGNWKYRNCTIQSSPLGKYPEMVTIITTPKKLNLIKNKKFINLESTKVAIETEQLNQLIDSGARNVNEQLNSIHLGDLNF